MRILKRLFFAIIYIAILFAVVFGFYKLFLAPPPPSECLSGQQGCVPLTVQPISVRGNVQIIPVATSTDHASILVQFLNSNPDYAAQSFNYDIKLTDQNGSSTDIVGSSFMYAGELKYLAFPNQDLGESANSFTASTTISNTQWVQDANFPKPTIFLQNQTTSIQTDHIGVSGQFTNGSAGTLSKATVIALLYNSAGNLVGISQTETDNIAPGASATFTINFPVISGVNVSNTQVFVYPVE